MKGTIYVNNGKWYYMVRLPGEDCRKAHPLCAPGQSVALSADRPKELAVQSAWRMWEAATKSVPTIALKRATVDDISARYIEHGLVYYRGSDGVPTSEAGLARLASRRLRDIYGSYAPAELTHADMLRVRDAIIATGVARITVNMYMDREMGAGVFADWLERYAL